MEGKCTERGRKCHEEQGRGEVEKRREEKYKKVKAKDFR